MRISLLLLLASLSAWADTPPPGVVKAKTYSGDGLTSITATGTALDVNVTNSGGLTVVDQGTAGTDPWFVSVRNNAPLPVNACQETGGNLAEIVSLLGGTLTVDGSGHVQPISASELPLPSGASTAAKQPALGTAGTPSVDVLTVQGRSGMTPLLVDASGTTINVAVTSLPSPVPVTGTFWQTTQPVSAAALPLPSGASTSANQSTEITSLGTIATNTGTTATNVATGNASLSSIDGKTPALGQALAAGSVPVVLTAAQVSTLTPLATVNVVQSTPGPTSSPWPVSIQNFPGTQNVAVTSLPSPVPIQGGNATAVKVDGSAVTQPISAVSLPLPSGAATLAKQPALGTAGTASADVITVQGISSMTALKVDGSAVTQPVSGSVTANIGTSGSLALDASVTGLQVSQGSTTSGEKGELLLGAVTTASPSYTTAQSNPFSLTTAGALRTDASATQQPVTGTFWQATQPVSMATAPALVASSAIIGNVRIDQTTPGTTNGVQVNAAIPAGSNVIGKVSIDQTTPGTTNLVALAANQSVNVAQINAATPLMGNGTTGTGSQRVTIASDNTAFSVNAIPKTPAATTVKQAAITVGTSAVRLTNDGSAPPSTRVLLVAQLLSTSTANCYFGSSGVTTTSTTRGVQMFAGQTLSFTSDAGDYYAICDAVSQTIYITEQE